MKAFVPLIGGMFLLIACAPHGGPRALNPTAAPGGTKVCQMPFPRGHWQLVHAIEGILPNGGRASAVGVTVLSTESKTVHCILMTVEGFVLFDGSLDGEIRVNRAVPPFDAPAFAKGLLDDIQFIFFPPDGDLVTQGTDHDGAHVCRYCKDDDTIVDVIIAPGDGWGIQQYRRGRRVRSVRAGFGKHACNESEGTFPRRMILSAHQPRNYTLTFNLIEAEPITKQPTISKKSCDHSLRLSLPCATFSCLFHRGVSVR